MILDAETELMASAGKPLTGAQASALYHEVTKQTVEIQDLRFALEWAERGIAEYESILKYGAETPMLKFIRTALSTKERAE